MPRLLVLTHAPTPAMRVLTEAVLTGTRDESLAETDVRVLDALAFARGEADHEDLLAADGYVLGTTANFGYMSGALKHVFDSTFLHVGGALDDGGAFGISRRTTKGRPFGLFVHGRYDTTGAVRSVLSITGALGWRQAFEVLECLDEPGPAEVASATELGATLASLVLP